MLVKPGELMSEGTRACKTAPVSGRPDGDSAFFWNNPPACGFMNTPEWTAGSTASKSGPRFPPEERPK